MKRCYNVLLCFTETVYSERGLTVTSSGLRPGLCLPLHTYHMTHPPSVLPSRFAPYLSICLLFSCHHCFLKKKNIFLLALINCCVHLAKCCMSAPLFKKKKKPDISIFTYTQFKSGRIDLMGLC